MIELIKKNDNGETYQADGFRILYKKQWTIAGDNQENKQEKIYLISGSITLTIMEKSTLLDAPQEIKIPAKTYHKIEALTDICMILFTD